MISFERYLQINMTNLTHFFKLSISILAICSQRYFNTCFRAKVRLLLEKLNHYFKSFLSIQIYFVDIQSDITVGDTASLQIVQ